MGYLCLSLFLVLAGGPFSGVTIHQGTMVKKSIPTYHLGPGGSALNGRRGTLEVSVPAKALIQWFRPTRYSLAAIFLVLGLMLMRGIYKELPGIRLNARWVARLGDGIFVLFLSVAAFGFVEYFMARYFNMTPFLNDEGALGVMAVAYFPAAAFFALFSSRQFGQSVEIKASGITVYSPDGTKSVPWEDVRGLELRGTFTVAGGDGFLAPRKMQTKLVLQTRQGPIELVEPGLKKIKTRIIRVLQEKSPPSLQGDISRIAEAW